MVKNRTLAAAGVAAIAVAAGTTGCGVLGSPGGGHLTFSPAAGAHPTPSVSSGEVISGSQDCAFSTGDGDYTVYVAEKNVQACTQVSTALATTGKFWSPIAWVTFTSEQASGSMPDADRACGLQDASMTMLVYQVASVDEPVGDGLAASVCSSEEANGWTATPEGATAPGPSQATEGTPAPASPAQPSVTDASAVVSQFYADISDGDYQDAWNLGGGNISGGVPYAQWAAGYATTASIDLGTVSNFGPGQVQAALVATQDDGTVKTYEGTYTVANGVIVSADITQTS
jgi:hypothetical protein